MRCEWFTDMNGRDSPQSTTPRGFAPDFLLLLKFASSGNVSCSEFKVDTFCRARRRPIKRTQRRATVLEKSAKSTSYNCAFALKRAPKVAPVMMLSRLKQGNRSSRPQSRLEPQGSRASCGACKLALKRAPNGSWLLST
eukprot:3118443-Pleurochrysis_carterae.AAC.1